MPDRCPQCGEFKLKRSWATKRCDGCGYVEAVNAREATPTPAPDAEDIQPLTRLPFNRAVKWNDQWFIADDHLNPVDCYYDHSVGDIIVLRGMTNNDLYFELWARATQVDEDGKTQDCGGYLIRQIDPSNEFNELPIYKEGALDDFTARECSTEDWIRAREAADGES